MQEEVEQKTVALAVSGVKLTAKCLKKAMQLFLRQSKTAHQEKKYSKGKIPINKLSAKGQPLSSMDFSESGLRKFTAMARKYNVAFSAIKDPNKTPPQYTVFFQGKNTAVIQQAMKEFLRYKVKKQQRVVQNQKNRQSILKKLDKAKEQVKPSVKKEKGLPERKGPER